MLKVAIYYIFSIILCMCIQALQYLQSLHSSPDSWQICITTLNTNPHQLDDKIKFVCLQVKSFLFLFLLVFLKILYQDWFYNIYIYIYIFFTSIVPIIYLLWIHTCNSFIWLRFWKVMSRQIIRKHHRRVKAYYVNTCHSGWAQYAPQLSKRR